jgi:hypothetical protein
MRRTAMLFALTAALAAPAGALPEDETYTEGEVVEEVETWLGVSSEAAAEIVRTLFEEQGEPNGFIRGGEAAAALGVGLRYGEGELVMASGETRQVFWQGPSIGWDAGGNASRTFTLVYGLENPDAIYQRFPGVEGSAYYIAGVGVNYQQTEDATLAPMRAGVGIRLGANIGYLSYSRERHVLPL